MEINYTEDKGVFDKSTDRGKIANLNRKQRKEGMLPDMKRDFVVRKETHLLSEMWLVVRAS